MKKWNFPIGLMVSDVLRSFFSKPVTQRYPFERKEAPDRFRGKLVWDLSNCTGCQLCIKDCPAGAIELVIMDRVNKRYVMRFHADRCTYCSQCTVNCRFKCLSLAHDDWELASLTKEPFTVYYGRNEDVTAYREQERSEL
jgi:formate hydrogenlyase subunit 6/NADH:ubiquinone oxidoreductase subunit I